jgi:hypothetical protein
VSVFAASGLAGFTGGFLTAKADDPYAIETATDTMSKR